MPATIRPLSVPASPDRAGMAIRTTPAIRILIAATLGSIPLMLLSIADVGGYRQIWDNLHWSISAVGGVLAIGVSVHGTTGRVRTVRSRAGAAFGLWALATLTWAVATLSGTPSVPSITDLCIVAIGVPGIGVLIATVHGRLSAAEEAAV